MSNKQTKLLVLLCLGLATVLEVSKAGSTSTTSTAPVTASNSPPDSNTVSTASSPPSSPSSAGFSSSVQSVSSPVDNSNQTSNISSTISPTTSSFVSSPSSSTPQVLPAASPVEGKSNSARDPTYIPMVAAIVSGCSMLVALVLLLVTMALIYKHLSKKDPMMAPLKKSKNDGGLYVGQESRSTQYLVSSMSTPSFGSTPSDVRLDYHMPSDVRVEPQSPTSPSLVYYNRSSDVDHHPGAHVGPYEHEEGYKPIQIIAADTTPRPISSTKI